MKYDLLLVQFWLREILREFVVIQVVNRSSPAAIQDLFFVGHYNWFDKRVVLVVLKHRRFFIIFSSDSSLERYVLIGDVMDIVCPSYDADVDFMKTEQSIIYRVSEENYETCTLSSDARELGRCISPMKKDKVKVSFRLLSPNPSALDYLPGQSYYFITTSTGTPWGLDNPKGGLCSSHQLKMIIHVGDYVHHHRHHKKLVTSSTTTPITSAITTRISNVPLRMQPTTWLADDPLWNNFFEKLEKVGNSVWSTVTRGERLALDEDNRRHQYESVHPNDDIEFQIHEIGEVESLFSAAHRFSSFTAIGTLLAVLLWI